MSPASRPSFLLRRVLPALAVLAVLGLVAWWLAGPAPRTEQYRTATVERGAIRVSISATGTLRALSTVEVGSQVSGLITSVEVDFNDRVETGQAIAHIDPGPLQLQLQQAQANLASARASLGEARATATNAERDYARREELGERQLVARSEIDLALAARDQARARVASAQSQVQQAQVAVERAQLDLGYAVIRSPVDGVVLSRTVEPGQTVAASFQTPVLFQIAEDLSQMQIELSVDEADVGAIRPGQPVRFTVDAFRDREFRGSVDQVRLAAVETSSVITYPVVVRVDNADLSLLPGMTANAEIETARRDDVLRVPNAALRFRPADAPAAPSPTARAGGMGMADSVERIAQSMELDAEQRAAFENELGALRERMQRVVAAREAGASRAPGPPPGGQPGQGGQRRPGGIGEAFPNFRASLDETQRAQWDTALRELASVRSGTIWLLENGRPAARSVRIGATDGTATEIAGEGVEEGARVITGVERSGP
ncbi:efflux RND transporter periplasmic adaptor subunit [Coralloluteibacterium thermophilus]|uniref:Efflux RND transporter periplasmic adaptor subunit n=1 Tax=Coralloluteibacterium thermophilum TaxID=2707049 RepID=A0ABV9NRU3_9GAMM